MCTKRADKTGGYNVAFNITDNWDTGFQGAITVNNTSSAAIEGWMLSFDSNFTISDLWNGKIVSSNGTSYVVANEQWTSPIQPNSSATIGFTATKTAGITAVAENFKLSEVVIDETTSGEDTTDTDNDKLPDIYETYYNTDPKNPDTDGDGLPDGYEVISLNTNPTLIDTDGNGISDANEDFDKDSLVNAKEYEFRTDPLNSDSDYDGLSDYDEITSYNTNPLKYDTDGDTLSDSDEITLGLNPNVIDTDGDSILDNDEKFSQLFTYTVENQDCAIKEVSVSMLGTGNLQSTTTVKSVMGIDTLSSDVVGLIGEPFDIKTTSKFDEAVLSFTVDQSKLGNTSFNDLIFLWYDETNNKYVELKTVLDATSSTVSTTVTHFSRYMIIDKNKWFSAWSRELNYHNDSHAVISCNTVLAIDCSGSMYDTDPITSSTQSSPPYATTYKSNRHAAARNFINSLDSNDKAAIIAFDGSAHTLCSLTDDKNVLNTSLNGLYSNGGTNFNVALTASMDELNSNYSGNRKYIILLSDGDDLASYTVLQKAKNSNITIHTVKVGRGFCYSLSNIASQTGGEYYEVYSADQLVGLYAKIGIQMDFDKTDTDGDGLYDAVESAGIRLQNGQIINTDPTLPDTDFDGLLDGKEIDPTIRQLYVSGMPSNVASLQPYYFKMISDPRYEDTDQDGDWDNIDPNPNRYQLNDLFIHNASLLYVLAENFQNEKGTLNTNKYSNKGSEWLVFMFIRYCKVVDGNHRYCIGNWPGVGGSLNQDFVDYVKNKDLELYSYFEKTSYISSSPNQNDIDLYHMAATITAIIYKSDSSDGIKQGIMNEKHLNNLAGWAGDLQTLVYDCALYSANNNIDFENYFVSCLGDNNSRCGITDLKSDADAVNIACDILTSSNSFNQILEDYYCKVSLNDLHHLSLMH
jgi:Mg-chelatase subunit ChlD